VKTLGLLGGMSWESTALYYRLINEGIQTALGGQHSAELLLYSVDFADIETLQRRGDWDGLAERLVDAGRRVESAGADLLLVCTNTMHKLAPQLEAALDIPLLHIADATAAALRADGCRRVGLLGTAFTMEQDFYRGRLEAQGFDVRVPDAEHRAVVHRVIYDELCHGRLVDASRDAYVRITEQLATDGAEAVILGCTEIGMLLGAGDTGVPLYDTTAIHAAAAVRAALEDA
jgi:aspartate racemase